MFVIVLFVSDTSYLGSVSCCKPASVHQTPHSTTHRVKEGGCCRVSVVSEYPSHKSRCKDPMAAKNSTHHQLQRQHSYKTV